MLRLTLLARGLIEAVLEGTEPDGLSLEKLYRLPAVWEEQRRAAGVVASPRAWMPERVEANSACGCADD
jgi:hypothetical protein